MIGKLFTVARPQVIIVLLAGAFGVAERASAQVFSEFLIPTANSLSYAITTVLVLIGGYVAQVLA